MMVTMDTQTVLGLVAVLFMAVRAHRRKSLTPSGIAAACIVGTIHALHPFRLIILLLVFFICGTKLTSWGGDIKQELLHTKHDTEKLETRGRTATQVFCNSGPASVCAMLHLLLATDTRYSPSSSQWQDLLITGVVAQYACSAADTFSSEIGILNESWPLLITTMRKVPPGTNGGVSLLGLIAALMGGGIIGVTACIVVPTSTWAGKFVLLCIGPASGLFGSLADSLLGATCQQTLYNQEMKKVVELHGGGSASHEKGGEEDKYIVLGLDLLDNNQVNLVSALLTMAATMTTMVVLDYTIKSFF